MAKMDTLKKVQLPDVKFVARTRELVQKALYELARECGSFEDFQARLRLLTVDEVSAAEQLRALLLASKPLDGRAFTIAEMRERGPILDKLEDCDDGTLLLQDTEYTLLSALLNATSWEGYNPDAVKLGDAVDNAEDVPVEEKKKR